MPLYDYLCLSCRQRFDMFMSYADYGTRPVTCPHCQSTSVRRRAPRIRVAKSEDSRMESLADDFSDPSALAGLENDPREMGRLMRKMGSELGEEMPPEFGEVVDRLEKGQAPEEIEKEVPGLGGDDSGGLDSEE
jgi:putative FmdB family regulatory protein